MSLYLEQITTYLKEDNTQAREPDTVDETIETTPIKNNDGFKIQTKKAYGDSSLPQIIADYTKTTETFITSRSLGLADRTKVLIKFSGVDHWYIITKE